MKYLKLTKLRKEKGLSHDDMSRELGISKAFYCQIENQKRRLNYPMAYKIAKILGKRPDEIFYDEVKDSLQKN